MIFGKFNLLVFERILMDIRVGMCSNDDGTLSSTGWICSFMVGKRVNETGCLWCCRTVLTFCSLGSIVSFISEGISKDFPVEKRVLSCEMA